MQATELEMREELMGLATDLLEDVVLINCVLECWGKSPVLPNSQELMQATLSRVCSYAETHLHDIEYLTQRLLQRRSTPAE